MTHESAKKKALKRGVKKTGVVMARGTKILAKRTRGAIKTGVKKTVTKENIRKTIKTIGKGIEGMALPPSETGKRKRQPMFGFETSPIGLDMKPPEVDLPSADFYFGSPKQVRKIRRHRRKTKRKKHRKKSRSKSRRKRKVVIYI